MSLRDAAVLCCAALVLALEAGARAADPPAYTEPDIREEDRAHWAFRPPSRPEPPRIRDPSSARNAIDAFILARLDAAGLRPLPGADRATLIRRVTFDLTGLPPEPAEVAAFLADGAEDAYERLVRRLLDSPAYGERWAQHWLDLARFAETDGFELDKVRPDAWRYRDWVIEALNADLPHDRFVQLQIAGDEVAPGDSAAAVATGFLLAGPDMTDINRQDERRHVALNDMTAAVGQVFMGLTFGCAQCHDHKTDPISLADFHRVRAAFSNAIWPQKDKPLGVVIRERGPEAGPEHVMVRGDFRRPGPVVEPGFPRVLDGGDGSFAPAPTGKSSGRRRALAAWLTRAEHPLTARVAVNWLWSHHFGRGIVPTPSDFGVQGGRPSHPELLDWLATELPRRGWSLKAMHELMVTSAAYRRASRPAGPEDGAWAEGQALDPENVLLWRASRRRLEGEAIRDALLAVSGALSGRRGGPGVRPPLPKEVTGTLLKDQWLVSPDPEDHRRRSIYLFARRNLRFPLFEAFDRPSADASCARRSRSTTAPQALALMNSELARDAARGLAARVMEGGSTDPESLIDRAYRIALGRAPRAEELRQAVEFLEKEPEGAGAEPAVADFALAILNSNEFVYID
jgi:hypothetical protein